MKTKIISVLLIFTIMFSATTLVASATEVPATSGEYGENLVWNFDSETGMLSINGSGDMYECATYERPWSNLSDSIYSVVVSDGVTSISDGAFIDFPNLTDVTIGKNVKTIGRYAFAYCISLTEITIPDSVISVAAEAFGYCDAFKKINVGSGLQNLDAGPFIYSFKLENITVSPQNPYLSNDENGVLYNKDKTVLLVYPAGKPDTEYTIPDSVTTINHGAFHFSQNLTSIKAPDSIEFIGTNAFYACTNLTDFSIPQNTVSIGDYAFAGCNITNITLPDSLTNLGFYAFNSCANAATVYIPYSLKYIDKHTFNGCSSLTDVYYGSSEEDWNKIEIGERNDPLLNSTIHFNHTHSYTEVIETEAECNKKGLRSFSCECGHYYTENIPETGHTDTDWEYKSDSVFVKVCPECSEEYDSLTAEIVLEKNEIQLAANGNATLKATVTDGLTVNIAFSSADESVAKVDSNGYISAVGVGQTVITANISGTDLNASCHISVTPAVYNSVWIVDGNETVYEIEEGAKIKAPDVPEKDGYVFIGWTPAVPDTMPSHDLSFTALFDCIAKSDEFDVSATFSPNCFNENVNLSVQNITADREPGGVYMVDGQYYEQIGLYNIKVINENSAVVQPNEGHTVTIKIPIPEAYKNRTNFVVYHRFVDGGREQLSTAAGTVKVENGYLVFEINKFSEFEVFAAAPSIKITNLPAKTVYACGENIDISGIELVYTDSNGMQKVITDTNELTVSGYNSKETGKQTVTVKYGDCSDTFEVKVRYTFWQWIIKILTFGLFKF